MKRNIVNINNNQIEPGLEWFVLKKRSQRTKKARFRRKKQEGDRASRRK
jgi:hypothetical protein